MAPNPRNCQVYIQREIGGASFEKSGEPTTEARARFAAETFAEDNFPRAAFVFRDGGAIAAYGITELPEEFRPKGNQKEA